ncbi:MAG: hypothetical protein NTX33_18030 [Propionibacteriales bacterium]|nr:hypothetical protein [Propionibacteriales bacterium]
MPSSDLLQRTYAHVFGSRQLTDESAHAIVRAAMCRMTPKTYNDLVTIRCDLEDDGIKNPPLPPYLRLKGLGWNA